MRKFLILAIFGLVGCIITGAYASPQTQKQISTEQSDIFSIDQAHDLVIYESTPAWERPLDMIHSETVLFSNQLIDTDTYLERSQKWIRDNNLQHKGRDFEIRTDLSYISSLKR